MKTTIALVASLTVALAGCGPSVTVEQSAPAETAERVADPIDVSIPGGYETSSGLRFPADAPPPAPMPCDPPCDDGNPCTLDQCQGGACVYPDDTELPACDDGAAVCVAGECCAAPRCFSKGACVDTCPDGTACNDAGICD